MNRQLSVVLEPFWSERRDLDTIDGIVLSGFVPWLLWRGYCLLKVPASARKAGIYLERNRAMFFPPGTVHWRQARTAYGYGPGKGNIMLVQGIPESGD